MALEHIGEPISYLVADDQLCLLVKEDWDGKSACVVRVIGEVDLADVGELRVQRIRDGVLARQLLISSRESPASDVN
jgi:hypothetical protein